MFSFGHCPNDLSFLSQEASGLVKLTSLSQSQNQGVQKMDSSCKILSQTMTFPECSNQIVTKCDIKAAYLYGNSIVSIGPMAFSSAEASNILHHCEHV